MTEPVLYLSNTDVRDMLTISTAVRVVEEDLKRQAIQDGLVLGSPLAWSTDDRQLGFRWRLKTAVIRGIPVAGVRIAGYKIDAAGNGSGGELEATRYIVLSDPHTGSAFAIVDEHSSFGMRAAASVVVAARYLANPDAATVGIIGVGNIGRNVLPGLVEYFPIREVRVTSLRAKTRRAFATEMTERLGVSVRDLPGHEEVVSGADIVVCATPTMTPYLKRDWICDGAFIGCVGHDEVQHNVYAACNALYVDYDLSSAQHPAHIAQAITEGAVMREHFSGELWQVVSGLLPGRRSRADKILVAMVGLTSQDISIAYEMFCQARSESRGTRLPL